MADASQLRRADTRAVRMGERRDPLAADGFDINDLGASDEAPPAYGDHMDQLQLAQSGFQAEAAVADDGRVNININESNRTFASLLGPALRSQLVPSEKGGLSPAALPPAYIPPSLGGLPGQRPPPKLNVVIQIVGSRGDVQPFVALGKVLKDTYGHRVRVATHATFQKFVEENGLEFFAIGGDPSELMAFMVKNPGLMPGIDALKSGEITKRRQGIEEIVLGCWRSCIEAGNGLGPAPQPHNANQPMDESFPLPGNPDEKPFVADAIIANPPSFAHVHIAEKLGIPLHMMFTMPWSPTRAFPHPLANVQSSNTDVVMTNYVSYALVEMMTWQGLGDVINRFRTKVLDLEPLSLIWAPGLLTRLRIPTTYCWSPALIPKPNDWGREISIAGFYFLNLASSYTPEPELADFLAAGPPPVYIGFGSIVVENPNQLTRTIFDAVSISGVRALVSKGWGGLGADSVGIPEGVFMLGNCPHDWLFKHVSAVVHHGGAGTSAAGINAGKPTVVVPFFGDQPFWGAMIAKAGAGPEPIPYKKLTGENLAEAIKEAVKPETQARAEELGAKIREEKGADLGGRYFHDHLDIHSLRCSIAPSRVAVWRVRRTHVRLSPLAAAVLVREGKVKYSDLKLYRSREYNTEDQPWDPISAVTSSLLGDLSGIAMAVADIPREIFKGAKKSGSGTPSTEEPPKTTPSGHVETASLPPSDVAVTESDAQTLDSRAETASLVSTRPSINITSHEDGDMSETTAGDSALVTSPDRTLSVGEPESPSSSRKGKAPLRRTSTPGSATNITLESAVGAGKGVSRAVTTGMRTPMNFCLGLAKGFRNAPKLYNDETLRPQEKVTDFASGIRIASKEFGLGLYDGITGLVTQPLRGAEKEGAAGAIKGFGKGIGGLILKPAAGAWSIPAYTMQGVHAEVRNYFRKSVHNYIVAARVRQGMEDIDGATPEEQRDIVLRWGSKKTELRGFFLLKQKEKKGETAPTEGAGDDDLPDEEPKTGWLHTRHLSMEERKKLHEQRDAWKRRQAERQAAKAAGGNAADQLPPGYKADENDELEEAIMASVRQTSRGDRYEDAAVEQAIRASVLEMRRIAERQGLDEKGRLAAAEGAEGASSSTNVAPAAAVAAAARAGLAPGIPGEDDNLDITDEEYQQLIAEAVRLSMTEQHASAALGHGTAEEDEEFRRALEESRQAYGGRGAGVNPDEDSEEDEMLRRAIEESTAQTEGVTGAGAEDEEEQLRKAMEESERAHQAQLERTRTEEEVILEYVKRQSLAEEEFRRQQSKGKAPAGPEADDEEDEDLRRALEESLRVAGKAGEGSGSGSGSGKPKAQSSGWGSGWKDAVEANKGKGRASEVSPAETPSSQQGSAQSVSQAHDSDAGGEGNGKDAHELPG